MSLRFPEAQREGVLMNIISAQVLSLSCLFVCMIVFFLLPCWWIQGHPKSFASVKYQLGLSLANCFSGGVFIGTLFVGLMPEIRVLFHNLFLAYNLKSDFPITDVTVFCGFLLALAIEQFAMQYQENKSSQYSSLPSEMTELRSEVLTESEVAGQTDDKLTECATMDFELDNNANNFVISDKDNNSSYTEHEHVGQSNSHGHSHGGHSHSDISSYLKGTTGIRLGMLIISLGVHSIFEGLALGLQTDASLLLNLVVGVAIHEFLVAFAMGVNVSRMKLPRNTIFKLALIFSSSIPVGQLMGLVIGHYQSTASVAVSAVLQGLAAGTFVHVTFFEVIPSEFNERGHRMSKVLFLGLGFFLFLGSSLLMPTNMSHMK